MRQNKTYFNTLFSSSYQTTLIKDTLKQGANEPYEMMS